MAIRCEELPFRLTFLMGSDQARHEVLSFYKSEEELYHVSPSVEVLENLQLEVFFECDDTQAKLYLEGIDELVSKAVNEEDGQVFISPTSSSLLLFSYNDYPLASGYYRIIVEVKGIFYYATISVKPLHISQMAWEIMRDDLEKILPGLAMDLVFRNLGFDKTAGIKAPLPPDSLFAFLIINQNFSKVMSALADLMTKVNFKIKKEYQEKPISSGAIVDDMSFRYKLRRPEKVAIIMSPVKSLNYDLQENRWIKQITFFLIRILEDFLSAVKQYDGDLKKEIDDLECYGESSSRQREMKKKTIGDMKNFSQKAKKMQAALRMLESAPWYSSVSPLYSGEVPAVLFMDSRYRILYNLYQQIKRHEAIVVLDKTYAYQWKCTYKLYELWCFVQVCKTLNDLGFSLCGGWLSDIGADLEKVLVPQISSGTNVQYMKDNVMIRISYDAKIPYMIEETDHDHNPIHIGGVHNKPDLKLDIYIDDIYSGSLLMDVKYRNPSTFWKEENLRTHQRSKVMSQLICYSTQCFSQYLYGNNPFDSRPVPEVWVMYPKLGNLHNNKFFPSQRIRFICLSPNVPSLLEGLLEERIRDFQKKATMHRQRGNG